MNTAQEKNLLPTIQTIKKLVHGGKNLDIRCDENLYTYLVRKLSDDLRDTHLLVFIPQKTAEIGNTILKSLQALLDLHEDASLNECVSELLLVNKALLLMTDSYSEEFLRTIYGFALHFGDKTQFIFPASEILHCDFLPVTFPRNITKLLLTARLHELQITLSEEDRDAILLGVNDLEEVDSALIQWLFHNHFQKQDEVLRVETLVGTEKKVQSREEIKEISQQIPAEEETVVSTNNSLSFLTSREQLVYDALNHKKFLTRQELAKIVWGNEAGENASADAIDQVISRLRRKFVQSGYSKSYIQSVKGEGISLNEHR